MFKMKHRVIIDVDPDRWEITQITGKNLEKDDAQAICAAAARMLGADKVKRKKRNA